MKLDTFIITTTDNKYEIQCNDILINGDLVFFMVDGNITLGLHATNIKKILLKDSEHVKTV